MYSGAVIDRLELIVINSVEVDQASNCNLLMSVYKTISKLT